MNVMNIEEEIVWSVEDLMVKNTRETTTNAQNTIQKQHVKGPEKQILYHFVNSRPFELFGCYSAKNLTESEKSTRRHRSKWIKNILRHIPHKLLIGSEKPWGP